MRSRPRRRRRKESRRGNLRKMDWRVRPRNQRVAVCNQVHCFQQACSSASHVGRLRLCIRYFSGPFVTMMISIHSVHRGTETHRVDQWLFVLCACQRREFMPLMRCAQNATKGNTWKEGKLAMFSTVTPCRLVAQTTATNGYITAKNIQAPARAGRLRM